MTIEFYMAVIATLTLLVAVIALVRKQQGFQSEKKTIRLYPEKLGGLSSKLIPDFYAETAALTKNYLMSLKKDITHFCSMFDYRSQGQEWGTSIDAIERSTDFLTGKG